MKKLFAIAAVVLLGSSLVAVQAQKLAVRSVPAKVHAEAVLDVDPYCGGDVELADESEVTAIQKVAPTADQAYYYRPAGSFFVARSSGNYALYAPGLALRPYASAQFKAQEAPSYYWLFQLTSQGTRNWYSSTGKNVNVDFGFEIDSVPMLSANDTTYYLFGTTTAGVRRWSQLYAVPNVTDSYGPDPVGGYYYASPKYFAYRDRDNTGGGTINYTGATAAPNSTTGKGYWYGRNESGVTKLILWVEKPQYPYLIRELVASYSDLHMVEGSSATLSMHIQKATKDDNDMITLGEEIALTTCEINDTMPEYGYLTFPLENDLEIDDEIAIVFTDYNNENICDFSLSIARDMWNDGFGQHGYAERNGTIRSLGSLLTTDRGFTAPTIFMQVVFPWVESYYSGAEYNLSFDAAGECVSEPITPSLAANQVAVWAADPSAYWTITTDDGSPVPDWITLTIEDQGLTPSPLQAGGTRDYTHASIVNVSVDENTTPAARTANIVLTEKASLTSLSFVVNQDFTSGISNVNTGKTVESVRYYNAAGVESSTPFDGVNIVVKMMNDGSKEVVKVLR